MNVIDTIGRGLLAVINWFRAAGRAIASIFIPHGPGAARAAQEAERLDRIRNPSKYRGKEI
jgi:hypothetical protein